MLRQQLERLRENLADFSEKSFQFFYQNRLDGPVTCHALVHNSRILFFSFLKLAKFSRDRSKRQSLQGYLGHKKQCPPQDPAIGKCLGPYGGPEGGGAVSYERDTPVSNDRRQPSACEKTGTRALQNTREHSATVENIRALPQLTCAPRRINLDALGTAIAAARHHLPLPLAVCPIQRLREEGGGGGSVPLENARHLILHVVLKICTSHVRGPYVDGMRLPFSPGKWVTTKIGQSYPIK